MRDTSPLHLLHATGSGTRWHLPWSLRGLLPVITAGAQPCLFQGAPLCSVCPTIAKFSFNFLSGLSLLLGLPLQLSPLL